MAANKFVLSAIHQLFADHTGLAQAIQKDPNDKTPFTVNPEWDPDMKDVFARFLKCGIVEVVPESDNQLYVLKSLQDNTPLVQNFVKLAAEELEPVMQVMNALLSEFDEDTSESCFELLSSGLIELRRIHTDLTKAVTADRNNGILFRLNSKWASDNKVQFRTLLKYGFVKVIPNSGGLCVLNSLEDNKPLVEQLLTSIVQDSILKARLTSIVQDAILNARSAEPDDSDEDEPSESEN
jgi:hypothetical protein